MKKVLYFNMDVGSAIQHAGDIFGEWIKETLNENGVEYEFKQIQLQDQSYTLFAEVSEFKPDIIILNEKYQKTYEATLYYKMSNPDTKVFFIQHVWQDLIELTKNFDNLPESAGVYDKIKFREFMNNVVDYIFILNFKPDGDFSKYSSVAHKVYNFSYPTNEKVWGITTKWEDRKKKFCYIGNIVPHKISPEFVDKIKATDIQIDCYGRNDWDLEKYPQFKPYLEKVNNTPNFLQKGLQPQDKIPSLFNEYKYFILSHEGFEPFNWALLQSISCGTIPLVVNDRNSKRFDPTWIDWAEGMYLGTDSVDQLIENLIAINTDETIDMSETSSLISQTAHTKFNYDVMKSKFSELLMNLVKNEVLYSVSPSRDFEFEQTVLTEEGEKVTRKIQCSSHNTNYNSADNASFDSAVDGSNDTGVLDYN